MNIEKKLNEISEYFKDKVIKGDYEVVKIDSYTCLILIDNKYMFEIWIANNPASDLRLYTSYLSINGVNGYFTFNNDEERCIAWSKLEPKIKECNDVTIKQENIKQYNKLKSELNL